MRIGLPFVISLGLTACSTARLSSGQPTPYAAKGKNGFGFSIRGASSEGGTNLLSVFEGNAKTSAELAMAYSVIAAFDWCEGQNQVTQIIGHPVDFTEESSVTKVASQTPPMVFTGDPMMPTATHLYTYPVRVALPKFATPFVCGTAFRTLSMAATFEPISRELVHPHTRDFKGGLLVRGLSKAKGETLREGDVIVAVGQSRIETLLDLNNALSEAPRNPVDVKVIRRGESKSLTIRFRDLINNIRGSRERILGSACRAAKAADPLPARCQTLSTAPQGG